MQRIGDGMRTIAPPVLGAVTAISSMSNPPAMNPEAPMGYPPPAVASTSFPPITPTTPVSYGDDSGPLSNTTLSANPSAEPADTGVTNADGEALTEEEVYAEVMRALDREEDEGDDDEKVASSDEDGDEGEDADDAVEDDDEVRLADSGGADTTTDQLEDA